MKTQTKFTPFLWIFLLTACLKVPFGAVGQSQGLHPGELKQVFKKLRTDVRVLYLAAHPDDENTRLISWLVNERGYRTGYLSLTRGDGGQNLIGAEQGIELGAIRTRELIAARSVDGAEQFFTRAFDFGYSKSPDETFQKWKREEILRDVVQVIRQFKPHVIITRFATDGSGGHGHHTASAMLAEEAFGIAANPERFPESAALYGTWQVKRLFYNSTARFFNPNADLSNLLKLDVGEYNKNLGKSYGEIAALSRSMHRSQGFGSALSRGEQFEYFKFLLGDSMGMGADIFNGLALNSTKTFKSWNESLTQAEKAWEKDDIRLSLGLLIKLIQEEEKKGIESAYRLKLLQKLVLGIAGIHLEVFTDKDKDYSPGDSIYLKANAISRTTEGFKVKRLELIQQSTQNPSGVARTVFQDIMLQKNIQKTENIGLKIQEGVLGNLSWLRQMPENSIFTQNSRTEVGKDWEQDFYFQTNWHLEYEGLTFQVSNRAFNKRIEPDKGESQHPIYVVPSLSIEPIQQVGISINNKPVLVSVKIKASSNFENLNLEMDLPKGWKLKTSDNASGLVKNFALKSGEEREITFELNATSNAENGTLNMRVTKGETIFKNNWEKIKYDHIPDQLIVKEAQLPLRSISIQKTARKIGYIKGAGDDVAACLRLIGYDVTELNPLSLEKTDLNQFQTLITGVRAFNTFPELIAMKAKLKTYMEQGGNLIVQYNTNSWAGPLQSDFSPYSLKIVRDRVTDENSPISFKLPGHPVLNQPNKITPFDFENWVQERGIYFAGERGAEFESPLAMNDPNEKSLDGGLVTAKVGKGNFTYTGLAFFRQLPAGVPGAYRLFVNLIEH